MSLVGADVYLRFWELRGKDVFASFGSDHAGMAVEHLVNGSNPGASTSDLTEAALEHCKRVKDAHKETLERLGLFHHKTEWTLGDGARQLVAEALEGLNARGFIKELLYPTLVTIPDVIQPIYSPLALDKVYKRRNVYGFNIRMSDLTFKVTVRYPEYYLGVAAVGVDANTYRQIQKSYNNTKMVELPLGFKVPMIPIDVGGDDGNILHLLMPGNVVADFNHCYKHGIKARAFLDDNGRVNVAKFPTYGMTFNENTAFITAELEKCVDYVESVEVERWMFRDDPETEVYTMPLVQMVVDTSKLSKDAIDVLEAGKIVIEPKSRSSQLKAALANAAPWCITRHGWWGIAPNSNSPLVLDTWFSSALWPLIVDAKLKNEHRLLYTCHDILHNWVSRMLMLSPLVNGGEAPIDKVVFHGMAVDENREKMSKSKGNALWLNQMLDEAHKFTQEHSAEKGSKAKAIAAALVRMQLSSTCTKSDLCRQAMSLDQAWWITNKLLECSKYIKLQAKLFDVDYIYDLPKPATGKLHEIIGDYFHHLIDVATDALGDLEFNRGLEMGTKYITAFSNYAIPLQRLQSDADTFAWLCYWYLELLRLLMPWCHSVILSMEPPLHIGDTNDLLQWPVCLSGSGGAFALDSKSDASAFEKFDRHVGRLYKAASESVSSDIGDLVFEVWGDLEPLLRESVGYLEELVRLAVNRQIKIKFETKF